MENGTLEKASEALRSMPPFQGKGWPPADSIVRQLKWCIGFLSGEDVEERPGPFSMGLIAVREFDMYGDQPELAQLINEVQRE
jgi:hypothetical protein